MSSLGTRTARSISYVGIAQLISLLLSLITVTVLARLLTPEDFGIVSIGVVFLTLFYTIQDFGVVPAVVQRDSRIEDSISVGITLRWIISSVLAVFLIAISGTVSNFFGNPDVSLVLIVFTLNLFILAFGFSSQTLLLRSLNFSKIAIAGVAQNLALAMISISLALAGLSYWSLVIGSIAGSLAFVGTMVYYERRWFKPKIDRRLMGELLEFGKHLLITSIMVFVVFNVDQVVIGKVLGVASLGIYYMAVKFGRTIGEQISGPVNRVLFPTMARIKEDNERLKTGYVQSLRMISIVAVPLSMGLSAISPMFVGIVFGQDWTLAVLPLAIISFQGLLNALISPAGNVLMSIGKPRYMSLQSTIQAAAILVGIYPATAGFGINGVCLLTTLLSLGVFVYFLLVLSSNLRAPTKEIALPMAPSMLSGAAMFVVVVVVAQALPQSAINLVAMVGLGALVYFAALHVTSRGRDLGDLSRLVRRAVFSREQA